MYFGLGSASTFFFSSGIFCACFFDAESLEKTRMTSISSMVVMSSVERIQQSWTANARWSEYLRSTWFFIDAGKPCASSVPMRPLHIPAGVRARLWQLGATFKISFLGRRTLDDGLGASRAQKGARI